MDSKNQNEKLDKFHLYPKLPIELRLLIWKWVAACKRSIEISIPDHPVYRNYYINPDIISNILNFKKLNRAQLRAKCPLSAPSMLSVCKEAREEGLKLYRIICEIPVVAQSVSQPTNWPRRPIYMNLDVDDLYFYVEFARTEQLELGRDIDDWPETWNRLSRWCKTTTTPMCHFNAKIPMRPAGTDIMMITHRYPMEIEEQAPRYTTRSGRAFAVDNIKRKTGWMFYYVTSASEDSSGVLQMERFNSYQEDINRKMAATLGMESVRGAMRMNYIYFYKDNSRKAV